MSLLMLSLFLAAAPEIQPGRPVARQLAPVETCASINPAEVRACVHARIQIKEQTLIQAFSEAREQVARGHADYGDWDNRTAPHFLDSSQGAWASYVEANCTVSAAFGGGSNSAISDRFGACFEEELDRRIRYLRQLAEGAASFHE